MNWYDWGSLRQQLITFGRAIQGVSPYQVTLEPDRRKCPTGWCNYSKREIAANPNLFPGLRPRDQYRATKAILVHEAGHRRFTTRSNLGPVVHGVFNILEDERIERLMADHFAGLGHLLRYLAELALVGLSAMNPGSDQPEEILNYMLRLRWLERLGEKMEPRFSPLNAERWIQVEPLVRTAWSAGTSPAVESCATQIVEILGLRELPEWLSQILALFGTLEGERAEGDAAEEARSTDRSPATDRPSKDEDFDGVPPPHSRPLEKESQSVEPAPYLDLVAQVEPLVAELAAELAWTPQGAQFENAPRGGRFSMREWMHTRTEPFVVEVDVPRPPPTLAFRVLIDHSTSMNHYGRMDAARAGAMLLHLLGVQLALPHEITLTPNDLRIANRTTGERGLALIAGLVGEMSYEGIDGTLRVHAQELLAQGSQIKLVLVIHDGYPDTPKEVKSLCRNLRGQVEVIALGLGYDERMAQALRDLFGSDRLILCQSPQELPKKLGRLLRSIYGK